MRGSSGGATTKLTRVTGTGLATNASIIPDDGQVLCTWNSTQVLKVQITAENGTWDDVDTPDGSIMDNPQGKATYSFIPCDGANTKLKNGAVGTADWAYSTFKVM